MKTHQKRGSFAPLREKHLLFTEPMKSPLLRLLVIDVLIFILFPLASAGTFAQACSEPSFRAASNFNTGLNRADQPRSLATADFNHDGNPDLVVGGFGPPFLTSRLVAVLFGTNAGSFGKPLVLHYDTFGVATGDFNGDGNPDIVLAGLKFFYGDGKGDFKGPDELLIPGDTGRVYAADFNNDGRSDVLYLNNPSPPFSTVFLSNGSGGFTQIPGPSSFKPNELSFGDFNADSKIDFVSLTSVGIQVHLGDGAGHFQPQSLVSPLSFSGNGVPQAADFNHDGKLDVVVNNSLNFRLFFPGDGAGGFGSPVSQQTAFTVKVNSDFNGDGHLDIAGIEQANAVFRVALGNGMGQFTELTAHAIGGRSTGMLTADFNRDGKSDIASVTPSSDDVSVVFGDGAGKFGAADVIAIGGTSFSAVGVGDFNGDGNADFAITEVLRDRVTFFNGNGAGSFPSSTTRIVQFGPFGNITYLTTADFNHDNQTDLVAVTSNLVIILFGGLPNDNAISLPGANFAETGDFNGDGHLDIVVTNSSSFGVSLGNGAFGFSPIQTTNLGTQPSSVSVGDFNGDGKLDLAIANQQPGSVSIFTGNGSGSFTPGSTISLTPNSTERRTIAVADFNSDTKPDLAVANQDSRNVTVFPGNGNGTFGSPSPPEVIFGPAQIVARDLNLDGRSDLALMNTRESSNISLLINDVSGSFLKPINYGVGDDPRQMGLGDFNGDGKPDVVVAHGTSGNIVVLLSAPCRNPDLGLKKSHQGNFAAGAPGIYKLTVTNDSHTRAVGPTTITDTLPQGLSFVSATGNGWQCSAAGQQVTCTHNAPLDAGEESQMILTVNVSAGAQPGVTNSATVSHPLDTNAGNNTSADITVVNNGATISGRIVDESGIGMAGVNVVLEGIVRQSITTSSNGAYSFSGLPEGLNYKVTPSATARFFSPVSKIFKNLRNSGSGDFVGRSQTNGKIAFSRNVNGQINIWTMNADGSGAVQLTNTAAFDTKPQWSPDGSKIAFERGGAVFVMNADGSDQRRVTPGEGNYPAWSADGKKLAYSKTSSAFPGIYTINLDGANERRIVVPFGGLLAPLSWSPDGSSIAFTRQPPTVNFIATGFHLYTMDSDGFFQKLIVDNGSTQDFEPDYSPDGLKLVYLIHNLFLTTQMAVANSDGTGQVILGQVHATANPSWSPDGTKLLFTENDDIWTANTDGTNKINLTQSGNIEADTDWQPARAATGPNPIDDAEFFVRQHYQDFLNRTPDPDGLAFWKNEITSCGSDVQCIEIKRINVSAAFFLSIEFQETGYLVERAYKTAYGDSDETSTLGGSHQLATPIVRLSEFMPDSQQISQGLVVGSPGWEAVLAANKQLFLSQFVERTRFKDAYPSSMSALDFVVKLDTNAGNPLSSAERNQLVADLTSGAKTRAQVLQAIAEDRDLVTAESNRAFVLMQYFGYLRRNPNDPQDSDYTGFDFWQTKLNQFNGNFINAEMVKAFISSIEYRQRFGL